MISRDLHLRRLAGDVSWRIFIPALILLAALFLGFNASRTVLVLLIGAVGALLLLQNQFLTSITIIIAALFIPLEFGTGTAVPVNPVTILIPALLVVWILRMMQHGEIKLVSSRVNRPLLFFVLIGPVSLLIGNAIWDPSVPRPAGFIVTQLGQVAIFLFSAAALFLSANSLQNFKHLRTLTYFFLAIAGVTAVLYAIPSLTGLVARYTTASFYRAPFWLLLFSLSAGQLLFNSELPGRWRLLCTAIVGFVLFHLIFNQVVRQDRAILSGLIGVSVALMVLIWLKIPRFRLITLLVIVLLAGVGGLLPVVYEFAGGDDEWFRSGGARISLITRVLEVTMHNPITGLGPAAYRHYTAIEPLQYAHIFWPNPRVSSHNNYVDIFAHAGIIGLGLFLWFMAEVGRLGLRLRSRFRSGFAAGYVNAMVATWAGILVIMLTADWFLPFVYNISFRGFQASVLVWMFFGGLVVLENQTEQASD